MGSPADGWAGPRGGVRGARERRAAILPGVPALILAGLSVFVGWLWGAAALAQTGHPPIQGPRPVHERLAVSDRVVHARIKSVEIGRIQLEAAAGLAGPVPETFEVKRSPVAPPPLEPGDEAILFLRGARPPYVLVDAPEEVIRWVEPDQGPRWDAAIGALVAADDDPVAQADAYLDWIDAGPANLRGLGASGLEAILALEPGMAGAIAPGRMVRVRDPDRPDDVRHISARLAALSPDHAGALCGVLAGAGLPLEPATTNAALRSGALARAPEVFALLERAKDDPDPFVRLAATRALPTTLTFAREETLSVAREIAAGETDRRVREAAERVLRDAMRPPPRPRRADEARDGD